MKINKVLKKCPKCKSKIEKNEGWNHMIWGVWGKKFDWDPELAKLNQRQLEQRRRAEEREPFSCKEWWNNFCLSLYVVMAYVLIWPTLCCHNHRWLERKWEEWKMTYLRFVLICLLFFWLVILLTLFCIVGVTIYWIVTEEEGANNNSY